VRYFLPPFRMRTTFQLLARLNQEVVILELRGDIRTGESADGAGPADEIADFLGRGGVSRAG